MSTNKKTTEWVIRSGFPRWKIQQTLSTVLAQYVDWTYATFQRFRRVRLPYWKSVHLRDAYRRYYTKIIPASLLLLVPSSLNRCHFGKVYWQFQRFLWVKSQREDSRWTSLDAMLTFFVTKRVHHIQNDRLEVLELVSAMIADDLKHQRRQGDVAHHAVEHHSDQARQDLFHLLGLRIRLRFFLNVNVRQISLSSTWNNETKNRSRSTSLLISY